MRKKIYGKMIEKLKYPDRWRMLFFADCRFCAVDPTALLYDYEHIFKQDACSVVGMKSLSFRNEKVRVVIKSRNCKDDLAGFFRSLGPSRSARNFRMALLLAAKKLPVVIPVMAAQQRKNMRVLQDILVSGCIENSMSLYDILFGRDNYAVEHWSAAKSQIIRQIAEILADMHSVGLWHRDSKAGNFLICRSNDNSYTVKLIDLDGIKRYGFCKTSQRMQSLWNLAETVSRFRMSSVTDLWRGFNIYCERSGINKKKRREIFYHLQRKVVAKRLLVEVKDSYKKI